MKDAGGNSGSGMKAPTWLTKKPTREMTGDIKQSVQEFKASWQEGKASASVQEMILDVI